MQSAIQQNMVAHDIVQCSRVVSVSELQLMPLFLCPPPPPPTITAPSSGMHEAPAVPFFMGFECQEFSNENTTRTLTQMRLRYPSAHLTEQAPDVVVPFLTFSAVNMQAWRRTRDSRPLK
jgi:hypothetical protein